MQNILYLIIPDEHTHYGPVGKPTTLDLFLTKNTDRCSRLTVLHELTSYHLPVLLEYGDPRQKSEGSWLKTFTNWYKYRKLMENIKYQDVLPDADSVEVAVETLTEQIQEAIAKSSVTKMIQVSKYGNLPPDLNERIERRANRVSNDIKTELKNLFNHNWEPKIESLQVQDGSFFKMTRASTKGAKKPLPTSKITERSIPNLWRRQTVLPKNSPNSSNSTPVLIVQKTIE